MAKTVFTHHQSRDLADLINGKIDRLIERRARGFNQARGRKMAIFAHDHIGIQINHHGLYDKRELELLFRFLAPLEAAFRAGVALDIGANIGNHALYFAGRFRVVHAFEPHPATFHLLAYNATLADNVVVHKLGLGSADAVLSLNEDPDNMGASSIRHAAGAGVRSVQIEVRRLDDLNLPLDGLSFVKIDVEGFEPQVLRGAAHTLAVRQPVVVLEQLEREFSGGTTEAIAQLRELGYRFCWPQSAHRSKRGLARRLDSVRNRVFGGPDRIELLAGDAVPPGNHNMLIAVPQRFQAALGVA